MKYALCALIAMIFALMASCVTPRLRNGLDIMADSMDCDADGRPPDECRKIMQRGIAAVAHDTAEIQTDCDMPLWFVIGWF